MFQKHLGLTLDIRLNFVEHIKNVTQKIKKTMGLLRKFQPILPRSSLLSIYKTFIRSQVHYKRDMIRKNIPRIRVIISKIEILVLKILSFL